jgi:Rrf2 family protein
MRLSSTVEWALHCCVVLASLDDGSSVSSRRFAEYFDLPGPYLNKALQALVRAGVLQSTAGASGGFRLARNADDISMLDVVDAVEGDESVFRCLEIRRCGAGASAPASEFGRPCGIAAAMHAAEQAWRDKLSSCSLAALAGSVPPRGRARALSWFSA